MLSFDGLNDPVELRAQPNFKPSHDIAEGSQLMPRVIQRVLFRKTNTCDAEPRNDERWRRFSRVMSLKTP